MKRHFSVRLPRDLYLRLENEIHELNGRRELMSLPARGLTEVVQEALWTWCRTKRPKKEPRKKGSEGCVYFVQVAGRKGPRIQIRHTLNWKGKGVLLLAGEVLLVAHRGGWDTRKKLLRMFAHLETTVHGRRGVWLKPDETLSALIEQKRASKGRSGAVNPGSRGPSPQVKFWEYTPNWKRKLEKAGKEVDQPDDEIDAMVKSTEDR